MPPYKGDRKMGEHNHHRINEKECITVKAYELWEKEGHKQGQDLHYWLIAEKTVKGQSTPYIQPIA
jgi:Protein of unknown function (DUF2934)